MEGEPIKLEASESKSKKAKSVKVTRVRKPSERIMKKTSFSKFTNVESDPIILDFDSDYSAPRLANPLPQNPKKTDHTANEISDTHWNIQYERRTKYKNESSGSRVAEHQRRMIAPQTQSDNLLIQTSLKPLFETLHSLSNPQKQYMCEIGIRDLLDITVDGIPSHIGFYVVSNFDWENMVLKVSGGQLPVNRQVVHHLLGLPLGDRNILELTIGREETQEIEDKLSVAIGKYPDDPTFNALNQKFKTLSEHISSDSDAENNDEFPDPEAARSPNTDDAQKEANTDGTELSQWWTEPETLEEMDISLALVKYATNFCRK
ncbi:hypothetical protein L1887_02257 [Cichorium endivia]|nr:hypothetical protein L1887_02257 [Cichorium endivia]